MPKEIHHCGHGVTKELEPHRGVRIWLMNCGEVRCSLSQRDYFLPEYINEYIDAAIDGKSEPGEWLELDKRELRRVQGSAQTEIRPEPASGDIWQHRDGGNIYVVLVSPTGNEIKMQRRPFGDSAAEPFTVRRSVFEKIQTGRLTRRVN